MTRIPVQPSVLKWAAKRADLSLDYLHSRFSHYENWLTGEILPTLNQLQNFASLTRTPIGFFFLPEPPKQEVPIPDFRTFNGNPPTEPSPDLLDTIYICQQRQEWYLDYTRSQGKEPLEFVGSLTTDTGIVEAAEHIRSTLKLDLPERHRIATWEDALRRLISQADGIGILVMNSGIVGNNTTRKLDTNEFRGFAISHPLVPLIFINGSDTKSAQMFTLAHELAHIWLGSSALSNATAAASSSFNVEQWCNQVAAEILVPMERFIQIYNSSNPVHDEMSRLARYFKVSTLVILRRMYDAKGLEHGEFWALYHAEVERLINIVKSSGGGDFYRTVKNRLSPRFTKAIVTSALEGQSTFTEAFRLLGVRKMKTFSELGKSVGVQI